MIKAIIFDKDGLMFDSEKLQYQAFCQTLAEYGYRLTRENYHQLVGRASSFVYPAIQNLFNIKDIISFRKKKRKKYRELSLRELRMYPGLLDLIQMLKKEEYKLAVASGSHFKGIKQELDQYELTKYFDFILSSEGLPSKPAPDVFLAVATELEILPNQCLVLEDSQSGVEAAKKAGMYCLAIPNEFTQYQDFSQADLVIESLKKVISAVQTLKQSKQLL